MILKPITELIDPCTRIARTMTPVSPSKAVFSGYLAFVSNGVLLQRRIHSMAYNSTFDTCTYIVHQKINYAINIPAKPLSGAFNVQSLTI